MAKKSKEIKFTKQEMESLNKVRIGFEEVQFSLGSLEIVRIQTENKLEQISNRRLQLETQYNNLINEEQELLSELNEKYGAGNFDPETGVFTPIK
jgi:septal ring factor EnvC (AmiA/AmiB activator)|tara:strand:+ start:227 stop:511 length:285 start_codon:yes stop_codon:yes gene_type:complete